MDSAAPHYLSKKIALLMAPLVAHFIFITFVRFNYNDSLAFLLEGLCYSILLFGIILLVPPGRLRNLLTIGGLAGSIIKMFLSTVYYYLFKSNLSASSFHILFETNSLEAKEFLGGQLDINVLFIFAGILFLYGATFQVIVQHQTIRFNRTWAIIFLVAILVWMPVKTKNLYFIGTAGLIKYLHEAEAYENSNLSNKTGKFTHVSRVAEGVAREVYVVVIGESTTRDHMSLYGYDRVTTPRLDSLSGQLDVYTDVISPHSHTIAVLPKLLTPANYEDPDNTSGTIIQLLNQAGFSTYWVSNQQPAGVLENKITRMARATQEQFFVNAPNPKGAAPYDMELMPIFQRLLARDEQHMVVFLHLMGTHTAYDKRYPPAFDKFSDVPTLTRHPSARAHAAINSYDNAVLYNDHLLAEVISTLDQLDASTFMLYFSDHGEDVYQINNYAIHVETEASTPMFRIPFVLWRSTAYRALHPIQIVKDREYMTDDLFYGMAQLCGVDCAENDATRSPFSATFRPRRREIAEDLTYEELLIREQGR